MSICEGCPSKRLPRPKTPRCDSAIISLGRTVGAAPLLGARLRLDPSHRGVGVHAVACFLGAKAVHQQSPGSQFLALKSWHASSEMDVAEWRVNRLEIDPFVSSCLRIEIDLSKDTLDRFRADEPLIGQSSSVSAVPC